MKMCTWIRHVNGKHRVSLLLTDIKGAFDKVDSDILAVKCVRAGFGDDVCKCLKAWLAPRTARVIVQGHESRAWHIEHQVYQGTVFLDHHYGTYMLQMFENMHAPMVSPRQNSQMI